MDENSLRISIRAAVALIEGGRRKHFTAGSTEEGFREFREGSEELHKIFTDVLTSGDLSLVLRAEYFFLMFAITEGNPAEKFAKSSAEAGLEKIEDALLALKAVKLGDAYKAVELAYPHHDKRKWRYKDMPKDAFHICCASQITRLRNGLSRFGVSEIDRDLIVLRIETLEMVQEMYCNMQRKTVTI